MNEAERESRKNLFLFSFMWGKARSSLQTLNSYQGSDDSFVQSQFKSINYCFYAAKDLYKSLSLEDREIARDGVNSQKYMVNRLAITPELKEILYDLYLKLGISDSSSLVSRLRQ